MKHLLSITLVLLLSSSTVLAQDFCKGDFNYNGSVGAEDVTVFLSHFGRSQHNNPCPPDGPSPVPKTGQTTSYATGDDGDLERGVALVTPRFTDNGDYTVTDNQTGLIWMKEANCFGLRTWSAALSDCNGLDDGSCGLTDGSNSGDWRLPNYKELISLIDLENYNPALPTGHPFHNVALSYWMSNTLVYSSIHAWDMYIFNGYVDQTDKSYSNQVWCVKGGHQLYARQNRILQAMEADADFKEDIKDLVDGVLGMMEVE